MTRLALHAGAAALLALAPPPVAAAEKQHAQPDAASLETRLEAQNARIRALEAQIQMLLRAQKDAAAAPSPSSRQASKAVAPGAIPPAHPRAEAAVTVRLRGRLQVDALALNRGDGDTPTGTQVRRFYLGAEGRLPGGFRYLADVDVAGSRASLQDVYLAYRSAPGTEIIAGYFKPPVTMDETTSDTQIPFLERSAYSSAFAPGRRIGIGINHNGNSWGLHAGLFGERDDADLDTNRGEAWTTAARAHADLLAGRPVLHVGFAASYAEPSGKNATVRIRLKPETNRGIVLLDTGSIPVSRSLFGGAELAFADGPFTLQTEGGTARYRTISGDTVFWGYSAQITWRPTGESRPYNVANGVFGGITPQRSFADGGPGAIEMGLRLSHVDLNNDEITKGALTTYGIVANWIPVAHIRLGANLIHAERDDRMSEPQAQTLLTLRAAVDW